jgi:glucose/mannose transport system permease protein
MTDQTAKTEQAEQVDQPARPRRRRRSRIGTWGPGLLLISPSIVLIGIFVYGLIGQNIKLAMSDKHTPIDPDTFVGLDNFEELLTEDRFQHALTNLAIYTVAFLVGTMFFGLLWAVLLERGIRGEGVFRAIYLFPMAVSFVAAGVVWRWLLNSAEGDDAAGINRLLQIVGLDALQNSWWVAPNWGMVAIALPAIWQLSGYMMALFLAGFRSIPDELREAARMDGASEFQLYRHVLFPQLSPVALAALIIAGHMSLKVFDIIYVIARNTYQVEVPATYMWQVQNLQFDPAKAAAIATVLLVVVAVLIVPYLVYSHRAEKR